MVLILIFLLIAAAAGVLGTVLEVTAVIVLSIILAVLVLTAGTFYYLRYRMRRFVEEVERRRGAYPAQGSRRPADDDRPPPELPS
jgi:hypothetical protein